MIDANTSLSEARRFLLAVSGATLFSLACLVAAIGPANADCTCTAPAVSTARPTLL